MSEIELILAKLRIVSEEEERGMYLCDKEHSKLLLDYIINLQNKYENQIHRYMNLKEYTTNLQEENERLKVNYKNDRSHQVNFDYFQLLYNNYSKDIIIDDLVYKCEDLDNCKRGYGEAIIKYGDYKSRCEKATEYINKNILIGFDKVGFKTDKVAGIVVDKLLNILNGGDE